MGGRRGCPGGHYMYRPYNRGEPGSILQASAPSNREGGYIGTQSLMGATVHSWQNCHFQSLALIPGNQSATFASGLGWGCTIAR